jgi:hypothetical protein
MTPRAMSSCPDLIRASIPLRYLRLDGHGMDCRVKPGNDDIQAGIVQDQAAQLAL